MGDKQKRSVSRKKARVPPCKRRKVDDSGGEKKSISSSNDDDVSQQSSSSSSKKLAATHTQRYAASIENDQGNAIVDMNLLLSFIKKFPCPKCYKGVEAQLVRLGGLAQRLEATCTNGYCQHSFGQDMSEMVTGKLSSTDTSSTAIVTKSLASTAGPSTRSSSQPETSQTASYSVKGECTNQIRNNNE